MTPSQQPQSADSDRSRLQLGPVNRGAPRRCRGLSIGPRLAEATQLVVHPAERLVPGPPQEAQRDQPDGNEYPTRYENDLHGPSKQWPGGRALELPAIERDSAATVRETTSHPSPLLTGGAKATDHGSLTCVSSHRPTRSGNSPILSECRQISPRWLDTAAEPPQRGAVRRAMSLWCAASSRGVTGVFCLLPAVVFHPQTRLCDYRHIVLIEGPLHAVAYGRQSQVGRTGQPATTHPVQDQVRRVMPPFPPASIALVSQAYRRPCPRAPPGSGHLEGSARPDHAGPAQANTRSSPRGETNIFLGVFAARRDGRHDHLVWRVPL